MSFLSDIFGGGSNGVDMTPMYNLYNQRMGQINDFSNQLAQARSKYITSVNNMYNTAYNQYLPDAQAAFAGKGLAVNGGAFAAELARRAAGYQAQLTPLAFQQETADLNSVNASRNSAWGALAGAQGNASMWNAQNEASNQAALGGLAGKLAFAGLGAAVGGPVGASFGQNFASNLGMGGASNYGYPMERTGTIRGGHLLWD